jgi:Amt family ammonium transporter
MEWENRVSLTHGGRIVSILKPHLFRKIALWGLVAFALVMSSGILPALAQDPPAEPATTEAAAPPAEPAAETAAAAEPAPAPTLNSGDTAWMLTATALVLFMTIPGLSLFYAGLVRSKNVLSVLMQCFVLTALVTIIWTVYGYSLSFTTTGMVAEAMNRGTFIGTLEKFMLSGITPDTVWVSIPEAVFVVFQCTFAIITPALIVGAFAERMKFSAMLLFMALWSTFVYVPMCHMVWSGPGALMWDLGQNGVIDFAGGTVVHINAGIAALVCAIIVGKRAGYPNVPMPPHNLGMAVTGAGMLWVGWFGFNAGSAVAANGTAGMAMLVTQVATAMAALAWMFVEWFKNGKPSVLGIVTGAVAGLVAITPASGSVDVKGALAIGLAAGIVCFLSATALKRALGYDDSLDAFGVHGVGGIVGALLTGVFSAKTLGGTKDIASIGEQLMTQGLGCVITIVYSGVLTAVFLLVIKATIGLRPDAQGEDEGLDLTDHDERGYNI